MQPSKIVSLVLLGNLKIRFCYILKTCLIFQGTDFFTGTALLPSGMALLKRCHADLWPMALTSRASNGWLATSPVVSVA